MVYTKTFWGILKIDWLSTEIRRSGTNDCLFRWYGQAFREPPNNMGKYLQSSQQKEDGRTSIVEKKAYSNAGS